ncbi:Methyltransferase domain-containing protein [Haladaptatus litoreus]|uniref:Methyltransferase domain-containing protein n=1 Tax=Haladaptatus litoreus TaxID=553468 RepID=A0A1N7FBR0_9EURY|nr:class I SAM-dependent methyltransferase [Haladaptatus litoreus]SIR97722.1 Methyltransferase domain-containing protein [Haladaptatus litoreus]
MGDYDSTPSFYTTDETFEKYLGQTSYYLALQDNVVELVSHAAPNRIVEMGSGTGQTAIRLTEETPATEVLGIDNRETVVEVSRTNADKLGLSNLTFETADMTEYVKTVTTLPEMVVLLYSFHHIPDPLQQKVDFLEECYTALPEGGHICIAETFLKNNARDTAAAREIQTRWAHRGVEAFASTFWSALDGINSAAIEHAQEVGEFSRDHELEAGDNVRTRDDEYLISRDWLVDHAHSVGFDVLLAEPVNSLGDGIVLLEK